MFAAVFSGVSVVWDREFGFLREMLVAPPNPDPDVLVPLAPSEVAGEEGEIRDITSHRLPRWIEVAGGF